MRANLVLVAMCHDDDENDVKNKGLHSKDAHTVAKLVLTLLKRLDEDNQALHSASAAALEICADLSSKMRSTFESCDNAAAVRVRETLLNADDDAVPNLFARFSKIALTRT